MGCGQCRERDRRTHKEPPHAGRSERPPRGDEHDRHIDEGDVWEQERCEAIDEQDVAPGESVAEGRGPAAAVMPAGRGHDRRHE